MSVMNATILKRIVYFQVTVPTASAVTIQSLLSAPQLAELAATVVSDGVYNRAGVLASVRIRNLSSANRLNLSHKTSPSTDVWYVEPESSEELPVDGGLSGTYVQMATADSAAQLMIGLI